jgi:hypothetical protein
MADSPNKREEWISRAVPYYILVLARCFEPGRQSVGKHYTKAFIEQDQEISLSSSELFERAVTVCSRAGLIARFKDDFGPETFAPTKDGGSAHEQLENAFDVFARYERQAEGRKWLDVAIKEINSQWWQVSNLPKSQKQHDVWEPIPVERNDPVCKEAVATLDKTIEAVRADNGYSATHSEERRLVLDKLSAASKRLKEDTQISWMYLRQFAFEPLDLLIRRFGKAATGLAASEAREALVKWLKERAGELLSWLLR